MSYPRSLVPVMYTTCINRRCSFNIIYGDPFKYRHLADVMGFMVPHIIVLNLIS